MVTRLQNSSDATLVSKTGPMEHDNGRWPVEIPHLVVDHHNPPSGATRGGKG